MNYTFEELEIIAEALSLMADNHRRLSKDNKKWRQILALADKVVKDQSSKGEA